jgi:hypothetical protein
MIRELVNRAGTSSDRQMLAGLMKITAALGDGHTGVHFIPEELRFSIVPIKPYLFEDGLGIQATDGEHADLLGSRIVAINGHPALDVVRTMKLYTEATSDSGRSEYVVTRIVKPELLFYAGLATRPDQFDLELEKDGVRFRTTLPTLGRTNRGGPATGGFSLRPIPEAGTGWVDAAPKQRPLWMAHCDESFWLTRVPEHHALYAQDNLVLDDKSKTFDAFFTELFRAIEDDPSQLVVLDLRLNGGGDNTLLSPLTPFFERLTPFQSKGRFFVIIGRATGSAAQNFTTYLERHTQAIFVGEPTSESPNHYGDPELLGLPSSKIEINVSRRYWQDSTPDDKRTATAPKISAPLTLQAFRLGRDPALEAIWKYLAAQANRPRVHRRR